MKLYQTVDGTMIGFYQEYGGAVECIMYRDVYETRLVTKKKTETTTTKDRYVNVLMPARDEIKDVTYYVPEKTLTLFRIVPGAWGTETVYVQGYYETQTIWIPEHTEYRLEEIPGRYEILPVWFEEYTITKYREVPGHYDIQNIWVPEYYVTRYYWQEARPARGIVGHWVEYQELIPAGYKDQRVWVETFYEPYEELVPAGYSDTRVWVDAHWHNVPFTVPGDFRPHRVWVDGNYEDRPVWIPAHEEKYTEVVPAHNIIKTETVHWPSKYVEILIPGETTTKTVEYQVLEEVWVGYEPVWSYVDPVMVAGFEVVDLTPAPTDQPWVDDKITIRNKLTGEELVTTAKYLGLAIKVEENEYVLP